MGRQPEDMDYSSTCIRHPIQESSPNDAIHTMLQVTVYCDDIHTDSPATPDYAAAYHTLYHLLRTIQGREEAE